MDFSKRLREDELMDDDQLSINDLKDTYTDLDRVNSMLGGNQGVFEAIEKLVIENPKEDYSIMDIGCGNGEMLRKVCTIFRKRGLKVQLTGIDLNEKAIVLAKEASTKYPEIEYKVVDIIKHENTSLQADIVISTLTMHHIAAAQIPDFLKKLTEIGQIGIIINDLQRSRVAYYLFRLFSLIFIRTKIAKNDGLISIRSGFLKKELTQYSKGVSGFDHSIRSRWAFRYVWVMRAIRPTIYE